MPHWIWNNRAKSFRNRDASKKWLLYLLSTSVIALSFIFLRKIFWLRCLFRRPLIRLGPFERNRQPLYLIPRSPSSSSPQILSSSVDLIHSSPDHISDHMSPSDPNSESCLFNFPISTVVLLDATEVSNLPPLFI